MNKNLRFEDQFPALTSKELAKIEKLLKKRFGYPSIPPELKQFLLEHNGCKFQSSKKDSETGIKVNLPFLEYAPVAGIFGIWQDRFDDVQNLDRDYPELFASNENSKENFDVLPDKMMSFAFEHIDTGSLFAVSVAERDYGVVYYYYDQYMYSIVGRIRSIEKIGDCYYNQKIGKILEKYKVNKEDVCSNDGVYSDHIHDDDSLDLSEECRFELSRTYFVPVAPTFAEFLNRLKAFKLED
ncbi:MAG: SMI1/KNR4 family protein [Zavarzinella sp.]